MTLQVTGTVPPVKPKSAPASGSGWNVFRFFRRKSFAIDCGDEQVPTAGNGITGTSTASDNNKSIAVHVSGSDSKDNGIVAVVADDCPNRNPMLPAPLILKSDVFNHLVTRS